VAEARPGTVEQTAERLLTTGLILCVAAVALQTVVHLLTFVVFDLDIAQFDVGEEGSAWAWASAVSTFAAAFAALLHAATGSSWRRRSLVLALLLTFLSFDDLVQLHEYVGDAVEEVGIPEEWELRRLIWPIVFFPLLALTFLLLVERARAGLPRERRFLLAGLALLAAAVAAEAMTPALFWIGWERETLVYELEQATEEGLELGGWMLIAAALTAIAVRAVAALPRR
jgi:hypothetical protein